MRLAKSPGQIGDNITCNLWPGVQWVPIPPTSQPDVVLEPAKTFLLTIWTIFGCFEHPASWHLRASLNCLKADARS